MLQSSQSFQRKAPSDDSNTSQKSRVSQVIETAGYKLGKSIGTGSYSSVRLALNLKSNNQMVMFPRFLSGSYSKDGRFKAQVW